MPKQKFDYDSDEFYEEIFTLAFQGLCDGEIADALEDRFGESLTLDTFSAMKRGVYPPWTEEENKRRSERLKRMLARGRRKTNAVVRGAYLKAALGGKKTKNKNVVYRHEYDDEGHEIGKRPVQTTEAEIELPPNIQALATWLMHHDEEWRRRATGRDLAEDDMPQDIERGVDIEAWIRKEVEGDKDEKEEVKS